MLKNYILVGIRNIKKQKAFSLINIIGMAVGMAGFCLFALSAGIKLNADKFHKNSDRIFSVVQVLTSENQEEKHTTSLPAPLIGALQNEFPEIQSSVKVFPAGRITLKRDNDSFYENSMLFVDPEFFSIFSFELLSGDKKTALSKPNSMIISENAAFKYFGEETPIGRELVLEKNIKLIITGVSKNIPRTSSLRYEFLVSMQALSHLSPGILEDWDSNRFSSFLLMEKGTNIVNLEERLSSFITKYIPNSERSIKNMYLFPFIDFRLKANHISTIVTTSHPTSVVILLAIGILLLLIVCINFINLSTARNMYRTMEVGMRKVIGASRRQLVFQFLGESILLSFLAIPAAILFYELLHPVFTSLMGNVPLGLYASKVSNSIWNYPFLLKYIFIAALLSGFFSGLHPAFVLSAYQPLQVIKGDAQTGRKKRRGAKIMIVFQFSLSILFIGIAGLLKNQSDHLIRADFGFNRHQIAAIQIPNEARSKFELLKTEISHDPNIVSITGAAGLPLVWESPVPVSTPEQTTEEAITMHSYGVGYDFIETMKLQIKSGRGFDRTLPDFNNFIISETAAKKLDWNTPLGKQLKVGDRIGTVIGVTKDFLFADIGFDIPPTVLVLDQDKLNFMLLRHTATDGISNLKESLKEKWQNILPDLPFSFINFDEYFESTLGLVDRFAGFLNMIGIAAVLFSCLGLLGLASYMIERRTKEIGIRKVFGATTTSITWMVMKEFLLLVAIANIIALSLIHYGWHKVLQTGLLFIKNIDPGTYIFAIMVSLLTAATAVLSQVYKTAKKNPVESIRFE